MYLRLYGLHKIQFTSIIFQDKRHQRKKLLVTSTPSYITITSQETFYVFFSTQT